MVKKVNVKELRRGMFIYDINCSWLNHPFFGRSMQLNDNELIEKIVNYGIREVYIDTDKGIDVGGAPAEQKVEKQLKEEISEIEEIDFDAIQPVSLDVEMLRARRVRKEAMHAVQNVMNNVKMGNQVQTEAVELIVDDIIVSLLRNPDALLSFGMLRKIDEYLYYHSISVCVLMVSFGKYLGFDSQILKEIGLGAMLHDIGTMKVPQEILGKKDKLTDEEYDDIKKHVEHGRIILEETEGVTDMSIIAAYQHHERIDGSGYPNKLQGNEISYAGQAMAIVDVYDALTTQRCFRKLIEPTKAIRMIYEAGGIKFNKELVRKFIRCIGIYPVGSLVSLESGLLAVVISHSESELMRPVVRIMYDTKKEKILMPYILDLSSGCADRIVSYESPDAWNILPETYL